MLALHVDEFLHREALVVRQIDEERLGDDLEVLFDSVSRFQGREETSLELRSRISKKQKKTMYAQWKRQALYIVDKTECVNCTILYLFSMISLMLETSSSSF